MKLDKIMILGLLLLLISPVNLLFSLNNNLVREGKYQIPDYEPAGLIVENNIAYIAGNNILQTVSVNDPGFIFQLGRFETIGDISGIFKYNEMIYTANGNNGFQIINISNILTPVSIGEHYDSSTIWDIFVSENKAYIPVEGSGLEIMNVTDPTNISLIGMYHDGSSYVTRIFVEGERAYLGEYNNGLKIIDVSDPSSPILLGHYNKTIYDIFVKDSIAYLVLSEGEEFWGLEIVDLTDPANPLSQSKIEVQTYNIFLSNQVVYLPIEDEEIAIFDISNSKDPKRIGQYPFPSPNTISHGNIIYSVDNKIYICTAGRDPYLMIIDQEKTAVSLNEAGFGFSFGCVFLGIIVIFISLFRDYSQKNSIDYYLKLYKAKKENLKENEVVVED